MSVSVTLVESFENYGKCLRLANDYAELLVTVEVGPRIISYKLNGGENMMFLDLNRDLCVESGEEFDKCFYPGATWYTYGGHRLWASPEIYPTTYYPENDPVAYEIDGNTVRLTPPEQLYTHFQFYTEVTLAEDSAKVTVRHKITNAYKLPLTVSPWAITVMAPGGVEILPMPNSKSGYLANRVLALWEYTNMADPRVTWGKDYIILRQDENAEVPFKIGVNLEHGWAAYINRGAAFIKRFSYDPKITYPDFNVKYETYTNKSFLEMETVGELKTLEPGESVCLEEEWDLFAQESFCPCDAEKMAAFVAKL